MNSIRSPAADDELAHAAEWQESARFCALRAEIDVGIAELDRGEGIPGALAVKQAQAEFRRLIGRAT